MKNPSTARPWQLFIAAGLTALVALGIPTLLGQHDADSWKSFARIKRNPQYMPVAPDFREYRLGLLNTGAAANYATRQTAQDYLKDVVNEGMYQWPANKMPLKVYVAPGTDVAGYRPAFRNIILNAFDSWSNATNGRITWLEASDRNKADITIDWTNAVTERPEGTEAGRTSTLTRLNTETNMGTIYGAKMKLMTRLPDREFPDEEIQKTCLHEAGHALGIQGHSPYRDDIMFYAVSPTQQPLLTSRDRATMTKLYSDYPALNTIGLAPKPAPALPAAK